MDNNELQCRSCGALMSEDDASIDYGDGTGLHAEPSDECAGMELEDMTKYAPVINPLLRYLEATKFDDTTAKLQLLDKLIERYQGVIAIDTFVDGLEDGTVQL